jgi:hypothetical protein
MTQTLQPKPLDEILPHILSAVLAWKANYTPEKIHAKVTEQLDTNAEQMVLKLLGFDNRWGKWEVDHCNGRAGNSAIGDYMMQQHSIAIKEFFDNFKMSEVITPALKTKIKTVARKEYEYRFIEAAERFARAKAEKDAQKIIDDLLTSDDMEKTIKLMKVIS